jgi:hypothetical protein
MAPPPKSPFAAMVGAKRRRMRSGGNVSTLANNSKKDEPDLSDMDMDDDDDEEEKTAQTSKCKGSTTIPIFLKSKFNLLENSSFRPTALFFRKVLTRPCVATVLLQRPTR